MTNDEVLNEEVNGIVIEEGEDCYTYLRKMVKSMKNLQLNYNWLITDIDAHPTIREYVEILDNQQYCWLSGEELTKMVEREDFQWIWGVLSGFPKDITLEQVLIENLPYAHDYEGFWKNPLTLQHSLSKVEIVAWDSSLTLVISKDKQLLDNVKEIYVKSEDLKKYNNTISL